MLLGQGGAIYENYPVSFLTSSGYKVCYYASYATPTTSSDLASCSGGTSYFVGAISSSFPTIISVGAFGTSGILAPTSSPSLAYYDSQGAYWYHYPGKSFGFADTEGVALSACDTSSANCASRLCWLLDQNVGGYRAGCATGLNSDSTWIKVIYRYTGSLVTLSGQIYSGVLYNYPVSSVSTAGYKLCYSVPYSTPTTTSALSACYGGSSYFVGAIPSSSPTTFSLGAYGTAGIFTATYSTSTAILDPSGVYWYAYSGRGFGFAGSSTINLDSCDYGQEADDCSSRLCWHLDQAGLGGYRAGCTTGLNADSTWTKVIYRYMVSPASLPTSTPTAQPSGNIVQSLI